jgi:DNA replication protein DnaC
VQVLILDDFLLTPSADLDRQDLLEILEDRYQSGATVITSQCPIADWHPNIGDPTLADTMCDRLLHNAYRIELKGELMRKNIAPGNQKNRRKEGEEFADETYPTGTAFI